MEPPKSLQEAIHISICIGPVSKLSDRLKFHLRTMMALKFQTAICECKDPDEETRLLELFESIMGEK